MGQIHGADRDAADNEHTARQAITLASSSPRRRELLETLGYDVKVVPPDVDETPTPGESAPALVERLAKAKAHAIEPKAGAIVVAADTVVVLDGTILGKPSDRDDAVKMLSELSGRSHQVITGYCVRCGDQTRSDTTTSAVHFRNLTADEIASYVATGEADDKAGAYGIQGRGAALVASVDGSYSNVVGLPVEELMAALRSISTI